MTKVRYVPPLPMAVSNLTRLMGQPIDPLIRMSNFSDSEFERFVGSIVYEILRPEKGYTDVYNFSGAGDKGRDVIGCYPDNSVDYYQCKNYSAEVNMSAFLIEIAKVIYYAAIGDIPFPKRYFMIARSGLNPAVYDLSKNPKKLKERLKKDWDKSLSKKITDKITVKLSDIELYLDTLALDNIDTISNYKLLEYHRRTSDHTSIFGVGMITRPEVPEEPSEISDKEHIFVDQIVEVVSDIRGTTYVKPEDLTSDDRSLVEYARRSYYSADSLRIFIRDTVSSEEEFVKFKSTVKDLIMPVYHMFYPSRHQKMLSCLNAASMGNIGHFWFSTFVGASDQSGVCHHLVVDGKIKWN